MGQVSSFMNKLFSVVNEACTRTACILHNVLSYLLSIISKVPLLTAKLTGVHTISPSLPILLRNDWNSVCGRGCGLLVLLLLLGLSSGFFSS